MNCISEMPTLTCWWPSRLSHIALEIVWAKSVGLMMYIRMDFDSTIWPCAYIMSVRAGGRAGVCARGRKLVQAGNTSQLRRKETGIGLNVRAQLYYAASVLLLSRELWRKWHIPNEGLSQTYSGCTDFYSQLWRKSAPFSLYLDFCCF